MGSKNGDRGKKKPKGGGRLGGNKKVISDPRFASMHSDPRFGRIPKRKTKVPIDRRFSAVFTDKDFALHSAPVDKRGRRRKDDSNELLRKYYHLDDGEEEKEDAKKAKEKKKVKEVATDSEAEEESGEEESEELKGGSGPKSKLGSDEESSEADDEDDDEMDVDDDEESDDAETSTDDEDEDVAFVEEEEDVRDAQAENVPEIEQSTHRLAVVNLDWMHVRAVDLYVVLQSFLPKGGQILKVAVYPSEFGCQRMAEEAVCGPVGLFDEEKEKEDKINDSCDDDEEEEDDDDDDTGDDEIKYGKLLAYEKSRLRYYFAVVECDSVATADNLYKSCDGLEFERSANVLDLRFIPDSMKFEQPPRDVATEAPASYEGLDFHTKALQHSNIPISWDDDEPQRAKTLKRKYTAEQLATMELEEYLASEESETDDDQNDNEEAGGPEKRLKKGDEYRALLMSGDGSDEDGDEEIQDMEVTFNTGLDDLSKRILEKKDKKSETVWEAHLRKKREKKKAQKNASKYSSEEESSDADGVGVEEVDDFFVEEPLTDKGNKKDARVKSNKKNKHLPDKDEEAVAEASKAELELLLADDKGFDNGIKGYNLKPKKSKGKRGKEVIDEDKLPAVDYSDPRFSAIFTDPQFALDPTDPQFKRSAVYARQMAQKQQKGERQQLVRGEYDKQAAKSHLLSADNKTDKDELVNLDALHSKKEKYELSSLVKSIKMKSKKMKN